MCYELFESHWKKAQDEKTVKRAPRKEKAPAANPSAQPQPVARTQETRKDERELEVAPV